MQCSERHDFQTKLGACASCPDRGSYGYRKEFLNGIYVYFPVRGTNNPQISLRREFSECCAKSFTRYWSSAWCGVDETQAGAEELKDRHRRQPWILARSTAELGSWLACDESHGSRSTPRIPWKQFLRCIRSTLRDEIGWKLNRGVTPLSRSRRKNIIVIHHPHGAPNTQSCQTVALFLSVQM